MAAMELAGIGVEAESSLHKIKAELLKIYIPIAE